MNRLIKNAFILIAFLSLASCEKKVEKEEVVITATTGIIADCLKNLLPDEVVIKSLMGPGIDPHLYKPTSADLAKLKEADIVVYNGLALEGKMEEILKNLSKKKPTLAVSDFLDQENLISSKAYTGLYDPHIWFDMELWREGIQGLSDSIYAQQEWELGNGKRSAYLDSLSNLSSWISNNLNAVPEEKRILVTAHDAFSYFGRAYGIRVVGLQGISTLSEAGLKDIENTISFIIENQIKAVFIENIVSPKAIKAVIEGCKLQGYDVELGGTLYSDALGKDGTAEGDYLGMIRHNVNTIMNSIR